MQRALMEVVIIGVLCGLVGCFVVLRGLAFIGDALAHAVFPGVVLLRVGRRILFERSSSGRSLLSGSGSAALPP
ncbi:metal ABC transporter permease [Candidatus Amarobacter glycogenicus]|uniref:metal ABC transporter permease n=1 Tax=Candidatus Amarobacter glycogenicus TaxID=3140699 RepID=UPI0031CC3E6C